MITDSEYKIGRPRQSFVGPVKRDVQPLKLVSSKLSIEPLLEFEYPRALREGRKKMVTLATRVKKMF